MNLSEAKICKNQNTTIIESDTSLPPSKSSEEQKQEANAGLIAKCRQYTENEPNDLDEDHDYNSCPHCGARGKYYVKDKLRPRWLGLGPTEWCRVCGADAIHKQVNESAPTIREWSLTSLVDELRMVEWAYHMDIHSIPEAELNRANFSNILSAIVASDQNYKKDSLWECKADKEAADQRYEYLIQLIADVDGGYVASYYHENGFNFERVEDFENMIKELEIKKAAKQAVVMPKIEKLNLIHPA